SNDQVQLATRPHHGKQGPPWEVRDNPAREAWTNGRSKRDYKPERPHGLATLIHGEDSKQESLHERNNNATAGCLNKATRQQQWVDRRQNCQQGPQAEEAHCRKEQATRR